MVGYVLMLAVGVHISFESYYNFPYDGALIPLMSPRAALRGSFNLAVDSWGKLVPDVGSESLEWPQQKADN